VVSKKGGNETSSAWRGKTGDGTDPSITSFHGNFPIPMKESPHRRKGSQTGRQTKKKHNKGEKKIICSGGNGGTSERGSLSVEGGGGKEGIMTYPHGKEIKLVLSTNKKDEAQARKEKKDTNRGVE